MELRANEFPLGTGRTIKTTWHFPEPASTEISRSACCRAGRGTGKPLWAPTNKWHGPRPWKDVRGSERHAGQGLITVFVGSRTCSTCSSPWAQCCHGGLLQAPSQASLNGEMGGDTKARRALKSISSAWGPALLRALILTQLGFPDYLFWEICLYQILRNLKICEEHLVT